MAASLPVQKCDLHNVSAPNINMVLPAAARILWILARPCSVGPQHDSFLLSASRFELLYNLPFQDAMTSFVFTQHARDHK